MMDKARKIWRLMWPEPLPYPFMDPPPPGLFVMALFFAAGLTVFVLAAF